MLDSITDGIVWMIRNYQLVIGIFVFIMMLGFIVRTREKVKLRYWSDEKLKARGSYLLARKWTGITNMEEYDWICEEQERRIEVMVMESTKEEWNEWKDKK